MWQDALVTECVVYHQCFQKAKVRLWGWKVQDIFMEMVGLWRTDGLLGGRGGWLGEQLIKNLVWTGCFRWVTRRAPLPVMSVGKASSTQHLVVSEFSMCVLVQLGWSQATRSRNVPSFLRWWGLSKEWNLETQRCSGRTRLLSAIWNTSSQLIFLAFLLTCNNVFVSISIVFFCIYGETSMATFSQDKHFCMLGMKY